MTITDRLPKWGQIKASAKIKSFDLTLTRGNALKKEQSLRILCHLSNNSIQLHELSHGSENQEHRILTTIELPGHRSDVRALALSSDDALFASGSSDLLKIWNTSSKTCLHSIPSGYILSVAFLPGNRYIVAGTKTGDLELFDLASGSLLDTYKAHEGPVWSLQIRPDKTGLVTGSQDKDVKFWDFRLTDHQSDGSTTKRITLAHTKTLKMTDDVLCIRISPDGRLLAVSLLDTTVKVFYTDSLKFFLSLYGHKLPVLSMDISSDNTLLVTGSSDKSIKLWGLDFGDCHKSLHAHDDSVTAVQFVWGTHFVFSASKDRSVKYWDMDKREKVQSLLGHQGEVWTLAVGKYGLFALSGSHDRSVRKWDKTEEQFVLDEAREEELEELYDQMDLSAEDGAIGSGAADAEPVEKEVGSAGLKTNETLKAGERIMEALIVAEEDRQALDLYDKVCLLTVPFIDTPSPLFPLY